MKNTAIKIFYKKTLTLVATLLISACGKPKNKNSNNTTFPNQKNSNNQQPNNQQPETIQQPDNKQPEATQQLNNQQPEATPEQPDKKQPETTQQPENKQPETTQQPDNKQPEITKQSDNKQPEITKQSKNKQPEIIQQPENKQPNNQQLLQNAINTLSLDKKLIIEKIGFTDAEIIIELGGYSIEKLSKAAQILEKIKTIYRKREIITALFKGTEQEIEAVSKIGVDYEASDIKTNIEELYALGRRNPPYLQYLEGINARPGRCIQFYEFYFLEPLLKSISDDEIKEILQFIYENKDLYNFPALGLAISEDIKNNTKIDKYTLRQKLVEKK